ncbi:MAG: AzlD domain-containing protein [Butyricicoccus sp.]|nr:AzlD domain-containing protein [Butyricicoccus pullicaecorum]
MRHEVYLYIAVMALVTYLIRVLPLTIIRKEIKNRTIRSFLYYMPYVTLSVMTFPAILSATETPISALAGLVAAVFFAWQGRSLFTVASAACIAVFIWEYFSG